MANIWMHENVRADENTYSVPMNSKQLLSNSNRSVKKQVFGELKNVMKHQSNSTPLKGNASKIDGLNEVFEGSKSLCKDVLLKQQKKQGTNQKFRVNKKIENFVEPTFDEEIFDSWDFDRKCCKSQKRDEDIWSEMHKLPEFEFSWHPNLERDERDELPIALNLLDIDDDDIPMIKTNWSEFNESHPQDFDFPELKMPDMSLCELSF